MEANRRRVPLLLGAAVLATASLFSALSLWGPVGFPIWIIVLGGLSGLAFYMAKRTETMYADRTQRSGSPVFSALLNGVRGGDLTVSQSGLIFERTRTPSTCVRAEWHAVRRITLKKKGPYGSAGILTVEHADQSPLLRLEVADSGRLLSVLRDLPEAEGKLECDL
jgi:hypothetical protein